MSFGFWNGSYFELKQHKGRQEGSDSHLITYGLPTHPHFELWPDCDVKRYNSIGVHDTTAPCYFHGIGVCVCMQESPKVAPTLLIQGIDDSLDYLIGSEQIGKCKFLLTIRLLSSCPSMTNLNYD